jgi:hypothetical protein
MMLLCNPTPMSDLAMSPIINPPTLNVITLTLTLSALVWGTAPFPNLGGGDYYKNHYNYGNPLSSPLPSPSPSLPGSGELPLFLIWGGDYYKNHYNYGNPLSSPLPSPSPSLPWSGELSLVLIWGNYYEIDYKNGNPIYRTMI